MEATMNAPVFTIMGQGAVRQSRGAEGSCCWICGSDPDCEEHEWHSA